MTDVFINFSNHPSAKWGEQQMAAAERLGEVIDLPFPNVPPTADEDEIGRMADECVERIAVVADGRKAVVHIQGEMTLLYAIVSRLKAAGVECVASTTQRMVKEIPASDVSRGERIANALRKCVGMQVKVRSVKVSDFRFVRFRHY